MKKKKTTLLIRGINSTDKERFKKTCSIQGRTMTEMIAHFIKNFIKGNSR